MLIFLLAGHFRNGEILLRRKLTKPQRYYYDTFQHKIRIKLQV